MLDKSKFVVTAMFYHIFPSITSGSIYYICMYIEAIKCKLSLYLKKTGLKYSTPLKSNLRCIGSCLKYLVKQSHFLVMSSM